MKKKIKLPISIVIPTLGHKHIINTLNKIFLGSHLPSEVLVVIPKEDFLKVKSLRLLFNKYNLKIIISNERNQVIQRINGFKKIKFKYVLQLDDDIELYNDCLVKLYNFINGRLNISVAPKYVNNHKLSKIYLKPRSKLLYLYHWLINSKKGYKPGSIAISGFNYSSENKCFGYENHDWLSGGAVLHHKKNLILENFYPYKFKKSFCEDVLHSLYLRKKNIRLIKFYEAKVVTTQSRITNSTFQLIFKNFYSEFLIRRFIVINFKYSLLRLYLYYFIYILRIIIKLIRQ